MAVYVDELKTYRPQDIKNEQARMTSTRWCHMTADTKSELESMAKRINLKPKWIQHEGRVTEHYDLTPGKRRAAIRYGAIETTARERLRIVTERGGYLSGQSHQRSLIGITLTEARNHSVLGGNDDSE